MRACWPSGDPAARHVVVDPHQARLDNCGLQVLEEPGLGPLVEHHAQESQLALPCMLGEGRRAVLRTSRTPDTRPLDFYVHF